MLPWGISSVQSLPNQGKCFLDECESLLKFLERFRGGSSDYNDFDPRQRRATDDFDRGYNNNKNNYNDYYDNQQGYGQDDFGGGYRDDDNQEDDDNYYYDDRGYGSSSPRQGGRNGVGSSSSSASMYLDMLPSIFKNGDRRVGLPLVGIGSVVTMMGMSLFFNKALLRLGNLLFICGVVTTMGIHRTASFFLQPEKLRATICLGLGIFLVFIGSPIFGMILEVFGLLNIFGNMFPFLLAVAKTMPGIGPLLNNQNFGGSNNNNKNNNRNADRRTNRYYDDDGDFYDDNYYDDEPSNRRGYQQGNDDRYF